MSAVPLLHLDAHLLVLSKPAGLLAVPGRGPDKQDCLSVRVQDEFPEALIVHRLDMATSGLMLMARSLQVQRALGKAFEARQVRKCYQALVHGHLMLSEDWREIALPLAADWPRRPLQKVDAERGKPSLTRWRALGHEGPHSRVQMVPVTGRTHQLRVHFSAIGHAIVGDALYADDGGASSPRLLLHACELELPHPVTGQNLYVQESPPF